MYKCQITGRVSRPLEKLNKITVVTRTRQYKNFDRETEEEWFSHGTEIAKELNVNEEGLRLWNSWTEEQRHSWLVTTGHVKEQ